MAPAPARTTLGVHLRYGYDRGEQQGAELGHPLFDLLAAVAAGGSIRQAANTLGISYRYAWGSLRKWEQTLGVSLIGWSQGQKARLTRFAERLLWAERRARTRVQPHIEALRVDLGRVLDEARAARHPLLRVCASHDLALPVLQRHAEESALLDLELTFQGSAHALRSLNEQQCVVAGFHVPALEAAAPVFARTLKPLLKPRAHRLIGCSRRMQGLMMRREHAALVRTFPDVVRHRLRFASRQAGSGTRMLIEHLQQAHSISSAELTGGFDPAEHSHRAVALCIASGVADAGVGVEAAALQFGLHFVPLVEESYFLACRTRDADDPGVVRLREILGGARWREILANLPGYRPDPDAGQLLEVDRALAWWRRTPREGVTLDLAGSTER